MKKTLVFLFRLFLIVLGGVLILSSLLALTISNMNFGIVMPFIIGTPLLFLGIFYCQITDLFSRSVLGRIIKWCMLGCYLAFSIIFFLTFILMKTAPTTASVDDYDVIIVLGAGIRGNRPSATLTYRLDKSIEVFNSCKDAVIIVSGGKGEDEPISEASAMKNYLISKGIKECAIIMEDTSTSTEENFAFSKKIIENLYPNGAKIAFVTNDFHVYRAKKIAEKQGISADGIASKDFAPLVINAYLRECAAIVQYFLTGRI